MRRRVKKILKSKFSHFIILRTLSAYLSFCYMTSRIEIRGGEEVKKLDGKKPMIFLFWHGRSLAMPVFKKKLLKHKTYGLFSDHADGQVIADLFTLKGINTIVASTFSSKGISGLKKSLSVLKKNESIGISPDGPRGPIFNILTDSAFFLSKKTGAKIIPVIGSFSNPKIFEKSWDKYMFARPFGKVVIDVSKGIVVPSEASQEDIDKLRDKTEKFMVNKVAKLDKEVFGRKVI
ncbi:MAG: DUF374 domain-containing protein [Alphaproteobacteria bacterium]|jgi:lysophospholipid acyltransferase (LPLAT)-like uncharacterized protein|nr:DUF374 domain-containing protein [Alphaproteobacteria bacterium]